MKNRHIFKFYGYSKIASPKDPTHLCSTRQGKKAPLPRPGLTLQGSRSLRPSACPSAHVLKVHGAIVTEPPGQRPRPLILAPTSSLRKLWRPAERPTGRCFTRHSCVSSCTPPADVSVNRFCRPSRVAAVNAHACSQWGHGHLPGGPSLMPAGICLTEAPREV